MHTCIVLWFRPLIFLVNQDRSGISTCCIHNWLLRQCIQWGLPNNSKFLDQELAQIETFVQRRSFLMMWNDALEFWVRNIWFYFFRAKNRLWSILMLRIVEIQRHQFFKRRLDSDSWIFNTVFNLHVVRIACIVLKFTDLMILMAHISSWSYI